MSKAQRFPYLMLGTAFLVLLFGAATVNPQSLSEGSKPAASGGSSTATQSSGASDSATSKSSASGSPAASSADKTSGASASKGDSLSKTDRTLMREMAQANLAEIQAGKLAQEKAQSEDVKKFAQQMVDDHTKANEELQQLAQSKNVTLPTQPDKTHQAMMKKLSGMSGADFDRTYMQQGGMRDHKTTHNLLQRAQNRAQDPELKALAAKTLPIVDRHLAMAQQMEGSKATTASGASGSKGTSASGGDKSRESSAKSGKSGSSDKQEQK